MSDHLNTETTELTPAAAIPADAFRDLAALIRLVTDERACRTRLRDLRQAAAAANEAKAALDAARVEHETFVAAEQAKLDEQTTALRERDIKIRSAEGMVEHRERVYRDREAMLDRQSRIQVYPSGLARDLSAGWRDPPGDEISAKDSTTEAPTFSSHVEPSHIEQVPDGRGLMRTVFDAPHRKNARRGSEL